MRYVFNCEIIAFIFIFFKINNGINAAGQFYTTNENKKYYVNTDKEYTWDNSIIDCLKMNMTLVAIDTIMEENALNNLLLNTTVFPKVPEVWIGGLKIPKTRTFIWITTGKPFDNWYRGIPDYNHDCVFLGWQSKTEWTDGTSTTKRGYICEDYSERNLQEANEKLKVNLKMEIQERENLQQELNQEKELSANLKEQLKKIKRIKENALNLQNTQLEQDQQLQNGESKLLQVLKNEQQECHQQLIESNEYEKNNNKKYFDIMFPNIQNAYFLPNIH